MSFLHSRAFGKEIGRHLEWGYDPPMLLDPAKVASVATAFPRLRREVLKARYSPRTMALRKIYPFFAPAEQPERDDAEFDELMPLVDTVRTFVTAAAAAKRAMVVLYY